MSNRSSSFRSRTDWIVGCGLGALTWLTGTLAIFIIGFLAWQAWPAFAEVGLARMVGDSHWLPNGKPEPEYQITALLCGSLLIAVGATIWAAPIGFFTAVYAKFFASRGLAIPLNRLIEMLAGVPSVVFGLWGLICVVPLINSWQPTGQSVLAGVIVLGLMIVPTMMLACRSAFESVPDSQLKAASALGLGPIATFRSAVLPVAMRGILAGGVLAITRAIGETMAVLMVCGNIVQIPGSVFDPVRTITSNIALEMGEAAGLHQNMLFATGFLLLITVTAIMLLFQFRIRGGGPDVS